MAWPHELLLTVGLCVPGAPDDQVEFIGSLDKTHLSGLIVGDHDTCPALSTEMIAEADRLGFPILLADARTPWAAVARHVAAANASSQTMQVLKLSKLYQVAADTDDEYEILVSKLTNLLGVGLRISDVETGLVLFEAELINLGQHEQSQRRYSLPSMHSAELVLTEFPNESLDSFLLVHLLKVLALNVDRFLGAVDHRTLDSELSFERLFTGKASSEAVMALQEKGTSGRFRVAAFPAEHATQLARRAAISGLKAFVGPGDENHYAFLPVDSIPQFRTLALAASIHVGTSSVFSDVRDVRAAASEADRVLSVSRFSDRLWAEFEGTTVALLARSHREADEIIASVLGPLADPSDASTKLRETLFAYLRNDRQWQPTANELDIHRQTLSYRLRRIEQETGMSASRSADLSAFWIAYQAWDTKTGT